MSPVSLVLNTVVTVSWSQRQNQPKIKEFKTAIKSYISFIETNSVH